MYFRSKHRHIQLLVWNRSWSRGLDTDNTQVLKAILPRQKLMDSASINSLPRPVSESRSSLNALKQRGIKLLVRLAVMALSQIITVGLVDGVRTQAMK
ncbi:hypothetical protein BDR03DRAFT_967210 [Suillus americanus]|nr:hypothetical protein BDR03DRAFT_967210 [Suillus americanus]